MSVIVANYFEKIEELKKEFEPKHSLLSEDTLKEYKKDLGILYFPDALDENIVQTEIKLCIKYPLYFILNYGWAPSPSGSIKITKDSLLPKHYAMVKAAHRFHKEVILGSRRSYKTTITNNMKLHATLFYPKLSAFVVTYEQATLKRDIIDKLYDIYDALPDILKEIYPLASKNAKSKTYIEFAHGSVITGKSTKSNPESVGRGGAFPIVYMDEAAFYNFDKVYGSIYPAFEDTSRILSKKGYPYFFIVTSTPKGREGTGKGFYNLWIHSIPIEKLYDLEKNDWKVYPPEKLYNDLLFNSDENYNGFVGVKIHWSEFPYRDEKWAEQVKKEIGFYDSPEGRRRWYQEYELVFLGSDNSLFPDDVLEQLRSVPPFVEITAPYSTKLKLWIKEFDPDDYYIFGIDTAKDIKGDFSAIEIYSIKTKEQVGELRGRFGFVENFADTILFVLDKLTREFNLRDNFKLAIENNSYGTQIVERLLLNGRWAPFVIKTVKKNGRVDYGINTNRETKREMVNLFYTSVVEDPKIINSEDLIAELFNIEYKSNGKIEAAKGYHDDLFMASCLAFYGAHILKERRELPPKIIYHIDKSLYELSLKEQEELNKISRQIFDIAYGNPLDNSPLFNEEKQIQSQIEEIFNQMF